MKTLSMNRIPIAAFAVLFSVILYSCQKENSLNTSQTVTEEQAATYSDESAQTEASFDDAEDVSMTAAEEEGVASAPNGRVGEFHPLFEELRSRIGLCATITVTPNDSTYPKTITIDFGDDVYSIEGRSKTEFNSGLTIVLNTESPLIKKVACPWISNGTLKIKINDRVLFLDYGAPNNGDCDNKALLTWNDGGNSRLITLP